MRRKIILINLVLFVCFALDRITKLYFFKTGTVVSNDGLVFGYGQAGWFYYFLVILIILGLFRILMQEYQKKNLIQITLVSFILIGALSNLLDRFKYGAVIDWIDVPWWSVFNLADVYIVAGTIIWLVILFYGHQKIPKA